MATHAHEKAIDLRFLGEVRRSKFGANSVNCQSMVTGPEPEGALKIGETNENLPESVAMITFGAMAGCAVGERGPERLAVIGKRDEFRATAQTG